MTYEELQALYDDVVIVETDLSKVKGLKGLYVDGCIAIDKKLSNIEKGCVLAEEIGHHLTTSGNILDQKSDKNRKQERKARSVAYDKMIGLTGLIDAYNSGCRDLHTVAEYLNVTYHFLNEAVLYYKSKYGLCAKHNEYIIYFEPSLGIIKLMN